VKLTTIISERFHAAVAQAAAEEGISASEYIRNATAEALRRSGHLARLYPEASAVLPPPPRPRARYRATVNG
jgi:hypothetical protein